MNCDDRRNFDDPCSHPDSKCIPYSPQEAHVDYLCNMADGCDRTCCHKKMHEWMPGGEDCDDHYKIGFCPHPESECLPVKEKSMEKNYETTPKTITLWAVLRKAPECSKTTVPSFIKRFAGWSTDPIPYKEGQALHYWLNKNPHAYPWFVEHGFLREVPEETYSIGNWFEVDGYVCHLVASWGPSRHINEIQLNLLNGHSRFIGIGVNDWNRVTKAEMDKLCPGASYNKIPTPSIPSQ